MAVCSSKQREKTFSIKVEAISYDKTKQRGTYRGERTLENEFLGVFNLEKLSGILLHLESSAVVGACSCEQEQKENEINFRGKEKQEEAVGRSW
jgi:hypothetical protein